MVNREIISLKNKYLKFTKLNKFDYQVKEIICDICNSKKKNLLSEKIKWGKNFDFMPVVSCGNCGYIFQKYKFDINFNRDFYDKTYREKIFKNSLPSKTFLKDQEFRGKMLFKFLQNNSDNLYLIANPIFHINRSHPVTLKKYEVLRRNFFLLIIFFDLITNFIKIIANLFLTSTVVRLRPLMTFSTGMPNT
jgi:hypothetical protein